MASGERQRGSVPTQEYGRREAHRDGPEPRRQDEHSEEPPSSGAGDSSPKIGDGERAPNGTPQEKGPGIGGPVCCPGEALLWQQSEYPAGTVKKLFARGSLRGLNPEALCGEAPKGQPVIRRENLEAVNGEAPKGQPRNHGCQAKQLETKPRGKELERLGPRQREDPQSSRWTRMDTRRHGGGSQDHQRGELAHSGRKWTEK